MPNNTYVTSVNGITGDLPYELDRVEGTQESGDYDQIFTQVPHRHGVVRIDAENIKVNGTSGDDISQKLQTIAGSMRPLIMEQIDEGNDYVMHVEAGIPYEPTA